VKSESNFFYVNGQRVKKIGVISGGFNQFNCG
jgi:hypothetical protein